MRRGLTAAVMAMMALSAPLAAQTDTTILKPSGTGFIIDFERQPIGTVLNALAFAANLNFTMTGNIPNTPATFRLLNPVPKEEIPAIIQSLAEQYGLVYEVTAGGLTRISPPARGGGAGRGNQPAATTAAATDMSVYVINLRHLNNYTLSQILMGVFSQTGRGGFNVNLLGGAAGRQGRGGQQQQGRAAGAAGAGGGGRGGGRGGGGGDDDQNYDLDALTAAVQQQLMLDPSSAMANGGQQIMVDPQDVRAIVQQQQQGGGGGGRGGGGRGGAAGQDQPNIQQLLGAQIGQVLQAATGGAAQQQIQPVIVPTEGTNQLIVRSTLADYLMIQALVQAVDLRPLQALIEVSIVEVRRSNDLNVGVSGTGNYTKQGDTDPRITVTQQPATIFDNARDFVAELAGGRGTVDFSIAINALATRGDVRVTQLPLLFAQNNRQAQLIVGEQRPFVATTQLVPNDNGVVNQVVQYRDVATQLLITPTINADGYVNMDVDQQVQDVTSEVQLDSPIISTRRAITSLFVKDGSTAVMGGLSTTRTDKTRTGIPFLSSIPILGSLFGATHTVDVVTEMYLFLTPHVIRDDLENDRMVDGVKAGTKLLKDMQLQQIIRQPDTTIRVVIPPDTATVTRIPQRVDSLGRRIPPDTTGGRGGRVRTDTSQFGPVKSGGGSAKPLASSLLWHGNGQSHMGVVKQ